MNADQFIDEVLREPGDLSALTAEQRAMLDRYGVEWIPTGQLAVIHRGRPDNATLGRILACYGAGEGAQYVDVSDEAWNGEWL